MFAKNYLPLLLVILLSTWTLSCKKTAALPAQPQNRILQYKVTNVRDTAIYGAINDSSRTITVYLPFYLNLQVIDPAIKVSEGATLQRAIEPVPVSDSLTTYTVKGKDGSTATYTLSIVIQAPPLVLQEISSATSTTAYPANGFVFSITGNFNTLNLNNFAMSLVSTTSTKYYPMTVASAHTSISLMNGIYTLFQPQIPADINSGLYRIRITLFGQNTATMSYPIRVYYPGPDILPLYTASPKQGESFTLTANYSSILKGLNSFSLLTNGNYLPLTIVSHTNATATIRVPADFPPGTYNNFQLVCEGYDAKVFANGTKGSITVQAK